jgi:hypothetical protein
VPPGTRLVSAFAVSAAAVAATIGVHKLDRGPGWRWSSRRNNWSTGWSTCWFTGRRTGRRTGGSIRWRLTLNDRHSQGDEKDAKLSNHDVNLLPYDGDLLSDDIVSEEVVLVVNATRYPTLETTAFHRRFSR